MNLPHNEIAYDEITDDEFTTRWNCLRWNYRRWIYRMMNLAWYLNFSGDVLRMEMRLWRTSSHCQKNSVDWPEQNKNWVPKNNKLFPCLARRQKPNEITFDSVYGGKQNEILLWSLNFHFFPAIQRNFWLCPNQIPKSHKPLATNYSPIHTTQQDAI